MDFKELFGMITFDMLLEGLGTVFGIGLLWYLFFGGGIEAIIIAMFQTLG